MTATLILASASPARAGMLAAAGVTIEARPARVDEASLRDAMAAEGAASRDIADALAEMKALRVSARAPGALVLGADQVLDLDGVRFDKPRDRSEARAQLARLRGATHTLVSAAVIARDGAPLWRAVGLARLTMRPFSDACLDAYLDAIGDDVLSTVGGYRIEGLGAQLFARVEGDHFTILGLPLLEVLECLRAQGVLAR
ncbi:MAG: Maf family protein [Rubrimonas sp.]|uniref:Maf family protein n=1 Tax=Rubrimonas sp. TaxID=2036015 RepID=UPI002FDD93CA